MSATVRSPQEPRPARAGDRVARPLTIAHRGASRAAPENTLAALRAAVARGCDRVEVDVQRTRDHALVLLHDLTLQRTTDVRRRFPDRAPWRVRDFTLAEIERLDAGSWFGPAYTGERVPTLDAALAALAGSGVGLLLELKAPHLAPGVVTELAADLTTRCDRPGRDVAVVVQSFDHQSMALLKSCAPELPVALLGKPCRAALPRLATWASAVNPYHYAADAAYVATVHELGMACLVWTVNTPLAVRRALAIGVDGVITDQPAELGPLLAAVPVPDVRRSEPLRSAACDSRS